MRMIRYSLFVMLLLILGACGSDSQTTENDDQALQEEEMAGGLVRELTSGNLTLRVQAVPSNGRASLNDISITGKIGDSMVQSVVISETDPLAEAVLADLNGDGNPEVYCFTRGAGSGSYGTVIAYTFFPDGSASQINVQSMDEMMQEGYMGHDEFAIEDSRFVRVFPIYKDGDSNHSPTGGTRRVIYALEAGEASLQLIPMEMQ